MNRKPVINKDAKIAQIDVIDTIGGVNWWTGEVSDANKKAFRKELKNIDALAVDTIKINIIGCPGGDVDHALNMHDMLKTNPASIETVITGMTASAATFLAQAASPGKRKMSENALMLIHNVSTGVYGNKNNVEETLETLTAIDNRIAKLYAANSAHDVDFFLDLMDENNGRGKWLDADQALEFGLIDEIFTPTKAQASVSFDKQLFANLGYPAPPNTETAMDKITKTLSALKTKVDDMFTNNTPSTVVVADLQAEITAIKAKATKKAKKYTSKLSAKDAEIAQLKNTIKDLENNPADPSIKGKESFEAKTLDELDDLINSLSINQKNTK